MYLCSTILSIPFINKTFVIKFLGLTLSRSAKKFAYIYKVYFLLNFFGTSYTTYKIFTTMKIENHDLFIKCS